MERRRASDDFYYAWEDFEHSYGKNALTMWHQGEPDAKGVTPPAHIAAPAEPSTPASGSGVTLLMDVAVLW